MLALALVLLVMVIALVVVSFVGSSEEVVIEFVNVTITTSVGGVFVAGVVAGLIMLASLAALRGSLRRSRQHSKEVRELRKRVQQTHPDGSVAEASSTADPGPSPRAGDARDAGEHGAESTGPMPQTDAEPGDDAASRPPPS